MKSYRERGMRLPILHTDFNRGIVNFNEERPYYLTYILRDYQGNEARYHFTVQGQRDSRIQPSDSSMRQVPCRMLLDDYLLYGQLLWPLHCPKTTATSF